MIAAIGIFCILDTRNIFAIDVEYFNYVCVKWKICKENCNENQLVN